MSDLHALCARVVVRHRGPGHLRLQLPPRLCGPAVVRYLEQGLQRLPGIRRVTLDPATGKLAIHYQDTVTSDRRIAVHLAGLLRALTLRPDHPHAPGGAEPAPSPAAPPLERLRQRLLALPPLQALDERFTLWRARAAAAKVIIGRQMEARPALQVFGKDPETAAINFINEVVTFYLIKVHWNRITQEWLPRPLTHYREWLALGYLVFLLVRSRRPNGRS